MMGKELFLGRRRLAGFSWIRGLMEGLRVLSYVMFWAVESVHYIEQDQVGGWSTMPKEVSWYTLTVVVAG